MKKHLTEEAVKAAKLPSGKARLEVYDTLCPGLVLRIGSNSKTWMYYFRHDGRFQKITIGNALAIKLIDARRRVNELAERVRAGVDPRGTDEDAPITFAELAEMFIARSNRATKDGDKAMLRLHVTPVIGSKRLIALTGPDFSLLKERILSEARKGEAAAAVRHNRAPRDRVGERNADRIIGLCKTILRFGIPLGYVTSDFTIGIRRSQKVTDARKRVLDDKEIVAFLHALPKIFTDEQRQVLMRLILLLGCRKGELIGAQISEFRLDADGGAEWHQPAERVKNRNAHVVPLCNDAVVLVERALQIAGGKSSYLFPSPITGGTFEPTSVHKVLQRAFKPGTITVRDDSGMLRSQKRCKILICPPFTVHDLRRTAATGMSKLGIPTAIIGKTLNHRSADQSVTGLVYNQHDFVQEKRHALLVWASHVAKIESRVTPPSVSS